MGRIIVAVGRRVGDFIMLRHQCLQSVFASAVEIPQSIRESNGIGLVSLLQCDLLYGPRASARDPGERAQDIPSSSSIMPAITDRPPSQNLGSLASSPNGLSRSE